MRKDILKTLISEEAEPKTGNEGQNKACSLPKRYEKNIYKHNTSIYKPISRFYIRFFNILAIYDAISANIGLFTENGYYLRILYMRSRTRSPRAQDISTKIDTIDLKFGGVI